MAKKKQRIVLLDTHAIIHRAYHALPDFTGPDGRPTGALYGLVSMLLRIGAELEPDYIAACYDLPGPTIRHAAYEDYKGTRAKIDDSLIAQIKESRKVFDAFSIPCYDREGFEADDLLGTIAEHLKKNKDVEVVIASGDMDTLQLVDGKRVTVYTLKKGLNDTIMYDEKAVMERFGFSPTLIPDYKGIRGDPSDNIKGVPGIGDKGATELITNFGSIEDIYKALKKDEKQFEKKGIKKRVVELLKQHKAEAELSKALATIRRDAPIAFKLPNKEWKESVDLKKVTVLFDEYGFRTLRNRVRDAFGRSLTSLENGEGEAIDKPQEDIDPRKLAEACVMLWLVSSDFTDPSLEDVLAFTHTDSFATAFKKLEELIEKSGRVKDVWEKIEKPLVPIVQRMHDYGVLIAPEVLKELSKKYHKELDAIEKKIFKAAGKEFNVNSPKQLGDVLFDDLGLKPERQKKTAGGARSTKESELIKLAEAHPIINLVLEYRELQKLLGTYIDTIPPLLDTKNRLHATFIQSGAATGRMASKNPGMQNIPLHSERGKAIRDAFVAPKGSVLLAFDYSQIELRLAAILSGDEKLCDIFRHGRDVHREVAAMVFGVKHEDVTIDMRRRAKVINFGILYGMGANALRQQLGSTTAEAHQYLDDYFATFKTLAEYIEKTKGYARKHGYTETLFGRRRLFPEMKSPLPYVRAQAERMAINAPMQGTQADIIKLAMVRIDERIKKEKLENDTHLLLQVHDELVYEIKKDGVDKIGQEIKHIMEDVLPTKETRGVPIIAEGKTGPNWGEMQHL